MRLGFFFLLQLACAEVYVPGTPGAPWTEEEVLIVKAKLYSIFNRKGFAWGTEGAPRALRLGFHDCLKYTDGTGGCDGCLNWKGMGTRFDQSIKNFTYDNINFGDNNGLAKFVEVMERLYTRTDWPKEHAPVLSVSLRDSGKSRADLWAFAAIAAVEYTTETNNMVCDGLHNANPILQCNYKILNEQKCHVDFPRPIKFRTGRRDCTEDIGHLPYVTGKEESHARPVGNGRETVEFFKKDFGFTGRETVAIMGAHTIGQFHPSISLFRYTWTGMSTMSFNNDYYLNLAGRNKVAYRFFDCTPITDAEGREGKAWWIATARKDTKNGGPVFWIHETYRCIDSKTCEEFAHLPEEEKPEQCKNVPEGHLCQADSDLMEDDPNIMGGNERMLLIFGRDECAISADIGLYLDFNVTADGIPYGCGNLENFSPENWMDSRNSVASTSDGSNNFGRRRGVDCGLNKLQEPEGSTPLHEIIDEYADSNDAFIRDFIPVLEKMLANGYDSNELQDTPDHWTGVSCGRPEANDRWWYYNCLKDFEIDDDLSFYIVSLAGESARVVKDNGNGFTEVVGMEPDNDMQRWVVAPGNQILNVGTGKALTPDIKNKRGGNSWMFDEEDEFAIRKGTSTAGNRKALKLKSNGAWDSLTWDNYQSSVPSQRFVKVPLAWIEAPGDPVLIRDNSSDNVFEGDVDSGKNLMSYDSNNPRQVWIKKVVEDGKLILINQETHFPFLMEGNYLWTYPTDGLLSATKGDQTWSLTLVSLE